MIHEDKRKNGRPSAGLASERRTHLLAWLLAVATHLLLLLLFALINSGWRYEIPEWVEMDFVSVWQEMPVRNPKSPSAPPVQAAEEKIEAQTLVKLPKRRMLEDEPPLVRPVQRREHPAVQEKVEVLTPGVEPQRPQFEVLEPGTKGMERRTVTSEALEAGEKRVQVPAPDLGKSVPVPFIIEGEAANRTVLHRVLPAYPPGLAREAAIKLQFEVLPDGVVANVVPMVKGDAILEKVAMEAFRQWRFNALPAGTEPVNQRGVITFRFLLR